MTTIQQVHHSERCSLPHGGEVSINYLFRALVTVEEGGYISSEVLDVWYGVEVPANWQPEHFQKLSKISIKFDAVLQQAAIDAFYQNKAAEVLPDEIEQYATV